MWVMIANEIESFVWFSWRKLLSVCRWAILIPEMRSTTRQYFERVRRNTQFVCLFHRLHHSSHVFRRSNWTLAVNDAPNIFWIGFSYAIKLLAEKHDITSTRVKALHYTLLLVLLNILVEFSTNKSQYHSSGLHKISGVHVKVFISVNCCKLCELICLSIEQDFAFYTQRTTTTNDRLSV